MGKCWVFLIIPQHGEPGQTVRSLWTFDREPLFNAMVRALSVQIGLTSSVAWICFDIDTSHLVSLICWNILLHFQAPLQRDFGEFRDGERLELADEVEEEEGEGLTVTDINMDFNAQLSPEVNEHVAPQKSSTSD